MHTAKEASVLLTRMCSVWQKAGGVRNAERAPVGGVDPERSQELLVSSS